TSPTPTASASSSRARTPTRERRPSGPHGRNRGQGRRDGTITMQQSTMSWLVLATLLVALGMSSPRTAAPAAACHSTCTEQLRECKQACASGGAARRDCRAACAERSNCTAPGARIRTLAYVVSECSTDPQGRSSLEQKLLIRRGNCDPVPVMEIGPSTPVPDAGLCRVIGGDRLGLEFVTGPPNYLTVGVFQAMAVLPDGSGVVFDVTRQFSGLPALTPQLPEEGIFFVRADGSGLRP